MNLRRPKGRSFAVASAIVLALGLGAVAVAGAASIALTSKSLGVVSLPVTVTTAPTTSVADTFTNQASPNTNSGSATTMTVQSGISSNRRVFVRFDLSSIPTTARVQSATLQLTMSTAPSASRTYEVDRVNTTWGETTLTWSNMPAVGSATAATATGTASGVNLTWDVTVDVKAFVANASVNFGWQLKDSTESSGTTRTATFATRESGTSSSRPKLTVIYAT